MNAQIERLAYITRCYNAVTEIIRDAMGERHPTPLQAERERRWHYVRRHLAHEMRKIEQSLPPDVQLTLVCSSDGDGEVWSWQVRQFQAWQDSGTVRLLSEGVEARSTLSERVS